MWTATSVQRVALALVSAALLALILAISFIGPDARGFSGPPPPVAAFQYQLITLGILASAFSVGLAVSRSRTQIAGLTGCAITAIVVGEYVAFGYWVPAPHGAFTAPFSLQGSILIWWGVLAFAFTGVFVLIGELRAQAPSGLSQPFR
jgi:uncharacterized membrane protein